LILVYRAAVCSDPNTLENLGKAPMLEAKETRLIVQRKDQQQKPGKIETLDVDDYASLFGSLPKLPSDANPTRCKLIESRLLTESQVKTAACIGADEALQAARLVLSHALPSPSAQSSAARPLYLIQVYQIAAETGAVMDRSRANSQVVRLEIQCEGNPDLDSQPASNRCMASQSVMPRAGGQSWTVYLGLTPLTQQAARKRKDRLQQRINKFELSGLHHPSGDPSNFQTLPLQTPPAYPHASPMCIDCYSMDGDRQVEPLRHAMQICCGRRLLASDIANASRPAAVIWRGIASRPSPGTSASQQVMWIPCRRRLPSVTFHIRFGVGI